MKNNYCESKIWSGEPHELIVSKRMDYWHYVNSAELFRDQFPCIHTINI